MFHKVVRGLGYEWLNNTLSNNTIECKFLAFYGVITQSVIQSFLKTAVCGASLSYLDMSYDTFFCFFKWNVHTKIQCNKQITL